MRDESLKRLDRTAVDFIFYRHYKTLSAASEAARTGRLPFMGLIGDKIRKTLDDEVYKSVIWKSVFRHGFPDTDRNRTLAVLSNVFLHLHPAKLKGHAVRMRYTWCMGGLSFFVFLILT